MQTSGRTWSEADTHVFVHGRKTNVRIDGCSVILKKAYKMDVVIKVASSEFDKRREDEDKYWHRLDKSIKDIKEGKGITFTMQELEEFIRKQSS